MIVQVSVILRRTVCDGITNSPSRLRSHGQSHFTDLGHDFWVQTIYSINDTLLEVCFLFPTSETLLRR